jgi:general secretion pathway protein D
MIKAMEQDGTADILSAPKVTTKSGSEAIIRVAETHRYPQDYDVETGQRTSPVVKPQDWADFDIGVTLKVTPVVNPENDTIDLDLHPESMKFLDFEEYKVGSNGYEVKTPPPGYDPKVGLPLIAKMPYFRRRSVETQVTIADGSTVVMGGLVDERTETFRDQVPFLGDIPYLGRLFRSEGSRSVKKNLVIYVTARQVDASGLSASERRLAKASSEANGAL